MILNKNIIQSSFLGDEMMYAKSLRHFVNTYKNYDELLNINDKEQNAKFLHKIKSATTLLGLDRLSEEISKNEDKNIDINSLKKSFDETFLAIFKELNL